MEHSQLIESLLADGWQIVPQGSCPPEMRKGNLVLTGLDGDLPQSEWFALGLYHDPAAMRDDCQWYVTSDDMPIYRALEQAEQQAIAYSFAAILQQWLSPKQWAEMRAKNGKGDYIAACASQDYCDANMAMDKAFSLVMGRDAWPEGQEEMADSDCALWAESWTIAKRDYLTE